MNINSKENTDNNDLYQNSYKLEFENIIDDLCNNSTVKKMQDFMQHCDTTCYDHCKNVAYYSYLICKKYNLDYKSAARAGMLHDLFLYDWRNSKKRLSLNQLHAFAHPKIALSNSIKLFDLNNKEKDIISKHMWPVTIKLPKYKESYIITFVDKFCALKETFDYMKKTYNMKKLYKYSYIFLGLFIFRII